MRLGIGSYTFAWAIGVPGRLPARPMDAFTLLAEAQRLGVRVAQYCDNLPLTRLTPLELERLSGEAAAGGIQIEVGTRGLDDGNLRSNLRLCERLSSPLLRVVVDIPGDEPSPDEVIARLQPLRAEFVDAGVRVAIENHDRFPSRALARIVCALGTDYAGICLDTVNSFGALEGPEAVVNLLGDLTLCLHVKDFTIRRVPHQMGFVVEGCAAGRGRLDVPWLLSELRTCPNSFNAILETWVSPDDSLQQTIACERAWADAGIRYLRTLIPE